MCNSIRIICIFLLLICNIEFDEFVIINLVSVSDSYHIIIVLSTVCTKNSFAHATYTCIPDADGTADLLLFIVIIYFPRFQELSMKKYVISH